MKQQKNSGFSLIELIIALAIAGLLLAIAAPRFANQASEGRISNQYNALLGSLYQARSEAINGASDITVCPKRAPGDNQCGGTADWENGWIVFRDKTNTFSESNASVSTGDEIISVTPKIKAGNTVTAFGSTTNSVMNVADVSYVRYLQDGTSSLPTGSIVICDASRGAQSSRVMNIVQTGDIQRGMPDATSNIPRDVFSRDIAC